MSDTNVSDVKGEDPKVPQPKNEPTPIVQGNIPLLTVQILEAINNNTIVTIKQNAELIKLLKDIADGRPK